MTVIAVNELVSRCHFERMWVFRQAQEPELTVSEPAELLSRCRFFEMTDLDFFKR